MKILIADDHVFVRKGVVQLLATEFREAEIQEVSNGQEALEFTKKSSWNLILLDISMPVMNGMEVVREIRKEGIDTPVLMLSMQQENMYALHSIKAGASGYVNKASATDELVKAIYKVLSGRKYVPKSVQDNLSLSQFGNLQKESDSILSEREMQVLQLIAAGKTVTDISRGISLTATAVSTYRTHILQKLSLRNNSDIIRFAMENGLA